VIDSIRNYFADLSTAVGGGWNRFWFTPRTAQTLGVLRIATGLLALYAVATFAPDLERWFGPGGMLPLSKIRELYDSQWSALDYVPAAYLWPAYWMSLAVIAAYVLGIGGRTVAVLATAATLSFFARAPLLTGEFESILAFLLVYLCIGRASDAFSAASFLRHRSEPTAYSLRHSALNSVSLRLLQIHIALAHLMMGLGQLAAPEGAWWNGEGIFLAAMRPGMALVDLTGLTDHPRIVAAWSHVMTIYLLAMPTLVWVRLARPLVLAVGVLVWLAFAVASGWTTFCLAMLTGLMAFVEVGALRSPTAGVTAVARK
jgi:hypothetical protein